MHARLNTGSREQWNSYAKLNINVPLDLKPHVSVFPSEGVCKVKESKFQRHVRNADYMAFDHFTTFTKMAPSTISEEREINYGSAISTLVRMIEEGKL